ncbi:MAG: hypothetical protein AAB919_01770 [Patescibacteria group bacterium]
MSIQDELDDFLSKVIGNANRGIRFEPGGIPHTHNRINAAEPVPPFKFELCTRELRSTGRLTDDDMDKMAGYICHGLLRQKPRPEAIVGIPTVGADFARRVEMHLRREGCYLPRLRLSKHDDAFSVVDNAGYKSGALCLIDDVIHRGFSKRRSIAALKAAGYSVTDCWVFLTYEQGAEDYFDKLGTAMHAISTVRRTLLLGCEAGSISPGQYKLAMQYLEETRAAV